MLTLTAVIVGLIVLKTLASVAGHKVKDGTDIIAILVSLGMTGVLVWQVYFRLLPLAWGTE